jgi:hypothetical protein
LCSAPSALSLFRGEFKSSGGSSPLLRFLVGMLLIIGCAVFIGCPVKMFLRIAAGDLTAWPGWAGCSPGSTPVSNLLKTVSAWAEASPPPEPTG